MAAFDDYCTDKAPALYPLLKKEVKSLKNGWVLFAILLFVFSNLLWRYVDASASRDAQLTIQAAEKSARAESKRLRSDLESEGRKNQILESKVNTQAISLGLSTDMAVDKKFDAIIGHFKPDSFSVSLNGVPLANALPPATSVTSVPIPENGVLQLVVKNEGRMPISGVVVSVAGNSHFLREQDKWIPRGTTPIKTENGEQDVEFDSARSLFSISGKGVFKAPEIRMANPSEPYVNFLVEVSTDWSEVFFYHVKLSRKTK